ncbi:phosphotransferase family protein [Halococcus saccharolyticus]|uniref:Aminoglycoside phosphotransferase n=1 Tax=Halococcus saccharolyticus DSM 5350 TaxID=1227455 RepID=M0MEI2_9EURY|nr:aminoglycoside phosphotransferase family protein [Halococcus saccharolyticus]EMA42825.1 aminoglycoside phosphotransferase [Halococcus saccharolyticus DSM 5350]
MTRDAHDALASHTTEYEIHRELHDVPPHRTYDVSIDGARAVCKLATGSEADPATEARIVRYVGEHTSIPVPRIIAIGQNHFIAEWHDGVPETDEIGERWARIAGAGMATLHAETTADVEATGLLRTSEDGLSLDAHETWPETIETVLEDRREYLAGVGYADVAHEALQFVREYPVAFKDCGDPVLCHGNLLPAHLGINDNGVACIIDFEHALVGPGEYDYWRTALPAFEARERPDLQRSFRTGYESIRALPDGFDRRAECYRMVNSVSYLKALHLQQQITGDEAERRAERMAGYVHDALVDLREMYG